MHLIFHKYILYLLKYYKKMEKNIKNDNKKQGPKHEKKKKALITSKHSLNFPLKFD